MKPTTFINLLFALALGISVQACAHGPYKGRVVEEDSGRPVTGAVAVGYWTGVHVNVAGGTTYCIDAREAVTDANGEFEIPDVSRGNFMIAIYKVGYQWMRCLWESLELWGGCMAEPAEWDGDRAIILLGKVPKGKLGTAMGRPPHISCAPKNGEPLKAFSKAREEFHRALKQEIQRYRPN